MTYKEGIEDLRKWLSNMIETSNSLIMNTSNEDVKNKFNSIIEEANNAYKLLDNEDYLGAEYSRRRILYILHMAISGKKNFKSGGIVTANNAPDMDMNAGEVVISTMRKNIFQEMHDSVNKSIRDNMDKEIPV